MPIQASDIGTVYDLLLATRDGSTLPCRNKDGQIVNLSQVAFMCSIDPKNAQHEETELQHKDNLVQLSGNLIDREFDQWPQITQGDWSGGTLQRVLTGGTPLTSFGPQSDPTRYWDGLGVLWPITDYLPQQGTLTTPDQAEAGAIMKIAGTGVTGGAFLNGSTGAYAYAYMQNVAPQHNILAIQTASNLRKIDPIPGSVNGTPMLQFVDYVFAFGYLWVVTTPSGGGTVTLSAYLDGAPPTIVFTTTFAAVGAGLPILGLRIAASKIGNKPYVAIFYEATGGMPTISLFDISQAAIFGTSTPIPVGDINGFSSIVQMEFQGDNLLVACVSGILPAQASECTIFSFNIPSSTFATVARFPACSNIFMCPVAGSIFVLATTDTAINGFGNTVDMYLVQGVNLQHIGPLIASATSGNGANAIAAEMEPVAFGPYAVFSVFYRPASLANTQVAVYAYDVLRGRLFKIQDFGGTSYNIFLGSRTPTVRRMAITAPAQRPVTGGTLTGRWMVGISVLSDQASASDVTNVQNMLLSPAATGFGNPYLQAGLQITSSIIDFTSAQPKLFRQAVATWQQPGLPADANVTIKLDVWLDQDPASLTAVPDFTTGAVGTGVGGGVLGQTRISLNINKVATKIVYRITTVGPFAATSTGAVKLVSVIVRAATGWTRTMFLTLADNAMTNDKAAGSTAWSRQQPLGQPVLDGAAAYNFMRQLWRQRGGEVTATFPNGDPPADWLLQDIHWDSPKPFGPSFRADERQGLSYVCQLKFREDI
jgi:hypothetical protein